MRTSIITVDLQEKKMFLFPNCLGIKSKCTNKLMLLLASFVYYVFLCNLIRIKDIKTNFEEMQNTRRDDKFGQTVTAIFNALFILYFCELRILRQAFFRSCNVLAHPLKLVSSQLVRSYRLFHFFCQILIFLLFSQ